MRDFRMDMFSPSQLLPTTVAGRIEFLTELLLGPVIVDDEGRPTGERGAPMIDRATYQRLVDAQ